MAEEGPEEHLMSVEESMKFIGGGATPGSSRFEAARASLEARMDMEIARELREGREAVGNLQVWKASVATGTFFAALVTAAASLGLL